MLLALMLPLPLAASSFAGTPPKTTASAAAAASASTAPVATASSPVDASSAVAPATSAPGAPSASDSLPRPTDSAMNGATYAVRLRDLEQRVDELKDQVRRSHTRLALLSDTIMSNGVAGSRAEVHFDNEMSSAFQLIQALVVMDGQVQYNRQDESGALADQKDVPIYTGSVPPGDHTLQIALTFQGNGYGVFSYLRGYKFEVKSSHAFTAVEGKSVTVTATAYEKGGVTTPLEQRPTVEWHEKLQPLTQAQAATATAPASSSAVPGAAAMPGASVGGGQK